MPALCIRPMQVPTFCGVHGTPRTVGSSLGPPPRIGGPALAGLTAAGNWPGGNCPPPPEPLTHTPSKWLGSVPKGQAWAGGAVAHRPAPTSTAHAPTPRKIFTPVSLTRPVPDRLLSVAVRTCCEYR